MVFCIGLFADAAYAITTTWTGSTDSNWTEGTNWDNGVPGAADTAEIPSGTPNNPVLSGSDNATASILHIQTGATIAMSSSGTLTLGSLTVDGTFNQTTSGIVTLSGDFTNNDTYNQSGFGNLVVGGNWLNTGTYTATVTSGGDIILSGDWTNNGTYNPNRDDQILQFVGSANQIIQNAETFRGLTVNKPGGGLTLNGNLVVSNIAGTGGNLSVTAGTVNFGSFTVEVRGTFVINANGTVNAQTSTLNQYRTLSGTWAQFNAGTGTVNLLGTVTQNIPTPTTFYNLTVNKTSSTNSVSPNGGTITVSNIFTLTKGSLNLDHITDRLNLTGATHTVATGGSINIRNNGTLGLGTSSMTSTLTMDGPLNISQTTPIGGTIEAAEPGGRYNLILNEQFFAHDFTIRDMAAGGLQINTTTADMLDFHTGSFDVPADNGLLLDLSGVPQSAFLSSLVFGGKVLLQNLVFADSVGAVNPKNVKADASTGLINFSSYSGNLSGAGLADDPSGRLTWTPSQTTTWTGATSTNWFLHSNWDNGSPGINDTAVIPALPVTRPVVNASVTIGTLDHQGGLMTIDTGTFTATGVVTVATGATLGFDSPAILTVAGDVTIANGATLNHQSSGNLDTGGNLMIDGTLASTSTGDIVLGGNWILTGTGTYTYTSTTHLVRLDRSANQTLTGVTNFQTLEINKTGGSATLADDITTQLNLNIVAGLLKCGNTTITVLRDLVVSSGAMAEAQSSTILITRDLSSVGSFFGGSSQIDIGEDLLVAGTFNAEACTVSVVASIPGQPANFVPGTSTLIHLGGNYNYQNQYRFYNFTINKPGATISQTDTITVENDFVLQAGIMTLNVNDDLRIGHAATISSTLNVTVTSNFVFGGNATLTVSDGGVLSINGTSKATPAKLTAWSGGRFSAMIHGTLNAQNFLIRDLLPAGIAFGATANGIRFIDGTFDAPANNGRLLDFSGVLFSQFDPTLITFPSDNIPYLTGLTFNNSGGSTGAVNVRVDAGSSTDTVAFITYDGDLSGPNREFDPDEKVTWTTIPGVVTLTNPDGIDVTEGGNADTYTLLLANQPTYDVTVTVTPDTQSTVNGGNPGEAQILTFTVSNWHMPQTVSVTAANDAVVEPQHSSILTHNVTSTDGHYNGAPVANVVAIVRDNDGVIVIESGGSTQVSEDGPTFDTYTVELSSQPAAVVQVSIAPDAQTTVSAKALPLIFDTVNWSTPQTVTVTAINDGILEGNHSSVIQHTTSSTDPLFDNLLVTDVIASVVDVVSTPTVTEVIPNTGNLSGYTPVYIYGTNFNNPPVTGQSGVRFGTENAAYYVVISDTLLYALSPPGSGNVSVFVENGSTSADTSNDDYAYVDKQGDFTFASPITLPVPQQSDDLVAGDWDNDGMLDLVTVSAPDDLITILRNTSTPGSISFASAGTQASGNFPEAISAADFDNDGKIDLATCDGHGETVSVYLNTTSGGTISFAGPVSFAVNGNPYLISAGDFDQDGYPDIAIVIFAFTLEIYHNNQDGTFSLTETLTTGTIPSRITFGNFDSDHKPDLAVANIYSDDIRIYQNLSMVGTIDFENIPIELDVTVGPNDISLSDFDRDGRIDVAATDGFNNKASVFRNTSNSNLSFDPRINLDGIFGPDGITSADYDGDGKADVVTGESQGLTLYRNLTTTGAITFSSGSHTNYSSTANRMISHDFDRDGKVDIATLLPGINATAVFPNSSQPFTTTQWLGDIGTDWNDPDNWSNGVPQNNMAALIVTGRPLYPVVQTSPPIFLDLEIQNQASVVVLGTTTTLTVTGDVDIQTGGILRLEAGHLTGDTITVNETLELFGGTLNALNTLSVPSLGKVSASGGKILLGSASASGVMTVNGVLELLGPQFMDRAVVSAVDLSFPAAVSLPGTINLYNFEFNGLTSSGALCSATTTIQNLQSGVFDNPPIGGLLLDLSDVGMANFDTSLVSGIEVLLRDLAFDNTQIQGAGQANVKATSATAIIRFETYGGALGGSAFEMDTALDDRLFWTDDVPNPPQGVTALAGNQFIDLLWSASASPFVAGFNLYRRTTPGGPYGPGDKVNGVLIPATQTSFHDDNGGAGLTNGQPYYYVLRSVNRYNTTLESLNSVEVTATPFVTNGPTIIGSAVYQEPQVWTLDNSPYIINAMDDVLFQENSALTVEPGVEIRFIDGNLIFHDNSHLTAVGTVSQHITLLPDSGTTDFFIMFVTGGSDYQVTLDYVDFTHVGITNSSSETDLSMNQCTMTNNATIFINDVAGSLSTPQIVGGFTLRNSIFTGAGDYALSLNLVSTIENCTFNNNTNGIDIRPLTLPNMSGLIFLPAMGDTQAIHLDVVNPYSIITEDFTIQDLGRDYVLDRGGEDLFFVGEPNRFIDVTINPGVTFKLLGAQRHISFQYCNLTALGTIGNPILFTPRDGPVPLSWQGLILAQIGSIAMDYVTVEYGNTNIALTDLQIGSIDHTTIRGAANRGITLTDATIDIVNSNFSSIANFGVSLTGSEVTFDTCIFTNISSEAIRDESFHDFLTPIRIPTVSKVVNCSFDNVGTAKSQSVVRLPAQVFSFESPGVQNFRNNTFVNLTNLRIDLFGRCWTDVTLPVLISNDPKPQPILYRAILGVATSLGPACIAADDRVEPMTFKIDPGVTMQIVDTGMLLFGNGLASVEGFSNTLNLECIGTVSEPIQILNETNTWGGFVIQHGTATFDHTQISGADNPLRFERFFSMARVMNCQLTGNGFGSGITFLKHATRIIPYDVVIDSCDISGFSTSGIFNSGAATPDFSIEVTNGDIHDLTGLTSIGVSGGFITVRDTQIYNNAGEGVNGTNVILENCFIHDNARRGINITGGENDITNCDILNNFGVTNRGLEVSGGAIVRAFCNYWGDSLGPGGQNGSIGQEISGTADFNAWLTAASLDDTNTFFAATFTPLSFSNLDGISTGTFRAKLQTAAAWTLTIRDTGKITLKQFSGSGDTIVQTWDGRDSSNALLAPGTYKYTFSTAGVTDATGLIDIDTSGMRGAITSPVQDATVSDTAVPILGLATGNGGGIDRFSFYRLSYGAGDSPQTFSQIGIDSTVRVLGPNGLLGSWDTSNLFSGIYTLKLEVFSTTPTSFPNYVATVQVTVANVDITNVSAHLTGGSGELFDPIVGETVTIDYTLSEAATVSLQIYDMDGNTILATPLHNVTRPIGANADVWNGRDGNGILLPETVYTYKITARAIADPGKFGQYAPKVIFGDMVVFWEGFDRAFDFYQRPFMEASINLSAPGGFSIVQGTTLAPQMVFPPRMYLAGSNSLRFDGRDGNGLVLGEYAYRVENIHTLPENFVILGPQAGATVTDTFAHPFRLRPSLGQTTTIYYDLSEPATVSLEILDPVGNVILTLLTDESLGTGLHSTEWNGQDNAGCAPSPGDCSYRLLVTPLDGRSETIRGHLSILK